MNNILEIRKNVYNNLTRKNLSEQTSPIVLIYNIATEDYNKIVKATQNFLCKSLSLLYKREFTWTENFLENNDELILKLKNKTPNGVLNPKFETQDEFSDIQFAVNNIFTNLGIYQNIKKLTIPNIRYKSRNEPDEVKSRPYYTGKMHSDAWVGHKGDAVFIIGLLGDINNNTVEFNNPIDVHDNFLHKAESFDEGNTRYKSLEHLGTLKEKTLVVMDHACLHRTLIKSEAKPRISLDVAVLIDSEYSHANYEGFDEKAYNYYDRNQIESIGKSNKYCINETIFNTTKTTIEINPR
jgi:hypothetical protein